MDYGRCFAYIVLVSSYHGKKKEFYSIPIPYLTDEKTEVHGY